MLFFFVVAPFCSCPASLVSRKFFAVGPGCAKCCFFAALRWAPRPFGGARAKTKNITQGVFFVAPAPGKGRGRRSPVWRRHGARAKKNTLGGVFFLLWPRAGAQQSFSFPCLSPGPQQKKKNTLGGVSFFALAPCRHGASPSPAFPRGRSKKKNTLGGVVFLLRPRADAHSLTAGLGGDASPSPGGCFFFLLRPRPDRGGVFLLWPRPDAHSLTVGWGDFGKARVVFCFCCGPAGSF